MILQKVVDDPQSGSCPNVSYADVAGPVANYNPTGSPYAVPTAEVKEVTARTRSLWPCRVRGLAAALQRRLCGGFRGL